MGYGASGKDDLSRFSLVPACEREVSEASRVWTHENGKIKNGETCKMVMTKLKANHSQINPREVGLSDKNYVINVSSALI